MNYKVSIIVPVYNVEKYLEKCFKTLKEQTYSNIEIILIDDGSRDNSGELCDLLAEQDERVVVIHKENGGLSDARNVGIKKSTGEYIVCVDSDDFVEKNYIKDMVEIQKKYNVEIVQCDYYICDENGNYKKENKIISEEKYFTKYEQMKSLLTYGDIKTTAWGKLYKKNLFDNVCYKYGKYHEDTYTTYKLLDLAGSSVVTSKKLYVYRQVTNSITHANFNPKHLDAIYATSERNDFIKVNYPKLVGYSSATICHAACKCLEKIINTKNIKKCDKSIIKLVKKSISQNLFNLIRYSNCAFKTKIFALISSFSIRMSSFLYLILK